MEIEPYAFQGASSIKDISFIGGQLPKDIVLYKESLFTANNTLNENIKIYLETGSQELDAYVNSVDRNKVDIEIVVVGWVVKDAKGANVLEAFL